MSHTVEVKQDGKKYKVLVDGIKQGVSYTSEAYANQLKEKLEKQYGIK